MRKIKQYLSEIIAVATLTLVCFQYVSAQKNESGKLPAISSNPQISNEDYKKVNKFKVLYFLKLHALMDRDYWRSLVESSDNFDTAIAAEDEMADISYQFSQLIDIDSPVKGFFVSARQLHIDTKFLLTEMRDAERSGKARPVFARVFFTFLVKKERPLIPQNYNSREKNLLDRWQKKVNELYRFATEESEKLIKFLSDKYDIDYNSIAKAGAGGANATTAPFPFDFEELKNPRKYIAETIIKDSSLPAGVKIAYKIDPWSFIEAGGTAIGYSTAEAILYFGEVVGPRVNPVDSLRKLAWTPEKRKRVESITDFAWGSMIDCLDDARQKLRKQNLLDRADGHQKVFITLKANTDSLDELLSFAPGMLNRYMKGVSQNPKYYVLGMELSGIPENYYKLRVRLVEYAQNLHLSARSAAVSYTGNEVVIPLNTDIISISKSLIKGEGVNYNRLAKTPCELATKLQEKYGNEPREVYSEPITFAVANFADTAAKLNAGDTVIVTARGEILVGMAAGISTPKGIVGYEIFSILTSARHGALLYRVQSKGKDNRWEYCGESCIIEVKEPGILQFQVNDGDTGNNSGEYLVNLKIRANNR